MFGSKKANTDKIHLFSRRMILLLTIITFSSIGAQAQKLTLYDIKCGERVNPLGLDSSNIRFSWKIKSNRSNVLQSAYEIRVSNHIGSLKSNKDLIWKTGKVNTDQSIYIKYQGKELSSSTKYFWQVRIWDNQGNITPWSEVQYWETGLLKETDWNANWIKSGLSNSGKSGPAVMFRKTFKANKTIKSARLYSTAHGVYEASINGERVSDEYFAPGWTSYKKRLQYQVYDVTDYIKKGNNGIGIMVGEGWHRGNLSTGRNFYGREEALLAQIKIVYTDGSSELINTDNSWKASIDGPIRMSDFYNGETYDARKEINAWNTADFDDSMWKSVLTEPSLKYSNLVLSDAPPVREKAIIKPIKLIVSKKGEKILDFGQNMVGWVKFTVTGKKGDSVILRHAEVLDKDGNFYTENLRTASQQIIYVLKGTAEETFQPHFSFQGFRYVKVEGNKSLINDYNTEAVVLYSDMEATGKFETSNPLINQLQSNIQWGQKGNFLDVPTDCPQRNERYGWTGDAQVFFNTAAYNMDVKGFFTKWLKDLKSDQFSDGAIPHVVPYFWRSKQGGAAGWADAGTIIPWNYYHIYGDKQLLEQQYPSMKQWISFMTSKSKNYLWNTGEHFGDWLFYAPKDDLQGKSAITDKYLIAQTFYINSLQIAINTAKELGIKEDVEDYSKLLEKVKSAFVNEYVTSSGRLMSNTQTAYVLSLYFDVLPEAMRAQTAKYLVENIKSYGNHLTTGFLGTPYLCHVLSRFGYEDIAYTLLMQESFPSWLYPVKMGATTIWERWDGISPDGTFQNPDMNSFNHYAYGAIGDWMYKNIGGINSINGFPGFKKFSISPRPGGGLTSAKAELETVYGKISSSWSIKKGKIFLDIIIPPNTNAEVILPNSRSEAIISNLVKNDLKNLISRENEDQKFNLGSGNYHFEYKWNNI